MDEIKATNLKAFGDLYKKELLERTMPFWVEKSPDLIYGGFYTSLDRSGKVYDTDKFVWLQARQVWMLSKLYEQTDKNPKWLLQARQGAEFLMKYGRDDQGNFYFSLDRKGSPLVQPYNIFSDCFAAMAFAALYRIDPDGTYATLALATFNNILLRKDNPKGKYNKSFPGTRELKNFALPMILSNLSLEMENILEKRVVDNLIPEIIHQVMNDFYDNSSGLILENVNRDGSFCDSYDGRLTSPGHAIEAMWFMLDLSERNHDKALMNKAIEIGLKTLEFGWDEEYGGIYYFLDIKGHPPEKLEWNQKLWWVHLETLVFLSKAYVMSGEDRCMKWFEKVHDYTWKHFRDPDYPEWYGYLDRYGKVQLPLKGGKWKGCFHVPRGLLKVWQAFDQQT